MTPKDSQRQGNSHDSLHPTASEAVNSNHDEDVKCLFLLPSPSLSSSLPVLPSSSSSFSSRFLHPLLQSTKNLLCFYLTNPYLRPTTQKLTAKKIPCLPLPLHIPPRHPSFNQWFSSTGQEALTLRQNMSPSRPGSATRPGANTSRTAAV